MPTISNRHSYFHHALVLENNKPLIAYIRAPVITTVTVGQLVTTSWSKFAKKYFT